MKLLIHEALLPVRYDSVVIIVKVLQMRCGCALELEEFLLVR